MTRQTGFTLLELLVVVAILSAIAMASFGLTASDRVATARIEDTNARLSHLRRATLGLETPSWDGAVRLSGYVADNGTLPGSVAALVSKPDSFSEQKGLQPEFYTDLDSACLPAGGTPYPTNVTLVKGHRGNYLSGLAHNGEFRDGWGNVSQTGDDADNFGWLLKFSSAPDDTQLTFTSLGINNDLNNEIDEAERNRKITIAPNDWQVDLNGWQVKLKNPTGIPGDFYVALLVFENTNTGGQWRQFRSRTCSDDGDWDSEGNCTLNFAEEVTCRSGFKREAHVPLGRHLLLLVKEDNTPRYPGGDDSKPVISARPAFYPGTVLPDLVLEVR